VLGAGASCLGNARAPATIPAVQPQPPGSVPPPPPTPGLVPPLGPPQRLPTSVRALALTAGLVLLAALSAWCGWEMASKDLDRLHALPYIVPVGVVLVGVLFAWVGTVWKLRSDGRVLEGTGVLGREGIDLTTLTGIAATKNRNKLSLTLHTPAGRLAFDEGTLRKAGPQLLDAVGRAVWAGQEQGRYVIPALVAGVWQMPVQPGAPKKGAAGTTGVTLITVGVLLAGLVIGIVLGID
jgi:hypothetical protein